MLKGLEELNSWAETVFSWAHYGKEVLQLLEILQNSSQIENKREAVFASMAARLARSIFKRTVAPAVYQSWGHLIEETRGSYNSLSLLHSRQSILPPASRPLLSHSGHAQANKERLDTSAIIFQQATRAAARGGAEDGQEEDGQCSD